MKFSEPIYSHQPFTEFLNGVGSVLDLSGTGAALDFEELHFQPTRLFPGNQDTSSMMTEAFPDDRGLLWEDWQKVGADMTKGFFTD